MVSYPVFFIVTINFIGTFKIGGVGGEESEKIVQSPMYSWSNSLTNSPTPLPSFVGYSYMLKPRVFFFFNNPSTMNPKYTFLLSHPLDQSPYILVSTQPVQCSNSNIISSIVHAFLFASISALKKFVGKKDKSNPVTAHS